MIRFPNAKINLDKSPDMGLSEDDVYKDYASMRGFMDRAYNFLDNFHSYQNCNNGRTPVSYTHLDVYKRQLGNR